MIEIIPGDASMFILTPLSEVPDEDELADVNRFSQARRVKIKILCPRNWSSCGVKVEHIDTPSEEGDVNKVDEYKLVCGATKCPVILEQSDQVIYLD